MEVSKIHFNDLRYEEWFQFMTEFKYLAEKSTLEALGIVELFALLLKRLCMPI